MWFLSRGYYPKMKYLLIITNHDFLCVKVVFFNILWCLFLFPFCHRYSITSLACSNVSGFWKWNPECKWDCFVKHDCCTWSCFQGCGGIWTYILSQVVLSLLLALQLTIILQDPFVFSPYHRAIREPFDYYMFVKKYIRPLIDFRLVIYSFVHLLSVTLVVWGQSNLLNGVEAKSLNLEMSQCVSFCIYACIYVWFIQEQTYVGKWKCGH